MLLYLVQALHHIYQIQSNDYSAYMTRLSHSLLDLNGNVYVELLNGVKTRSLHRHRLVPSAGSAHIRQRWQKRLAKLLVALDAEMLVCKLDIDAPVVIGREWSKTLLLDPQTHECGYNLRKPGHSSQHMSTVCDV